MFLFLIMHYLSGMENLKCPICNTKVNEVIIPFDNNIHDKGEVICENEYVIHVAVKGVTSLLRTTKGMIDELELSSFCEAELIY